MSQVVMTAEARKQLDELPKVADQRMIRLLERLAKWPEVSGAKSLAGNLTGHFRLRTGDYRLQFRVEGETIRVEQIGHRDGFYEGRTVKLLTTRRQGREYVLIPREDYNRLTTLAKAADLPPLPKPDANGNVPAVEYARASLARKIIRDRVAAGLTQQRLADMTGIRVETICRLERGKHTPTLPTIERIDRALKQAASKRRR